MPRVYEVTKGLGAGVVQGAARLGRPLVCGRTPKVCNLDVRGGAARSRAPARALAVTVTGWGSSLSGAWGAVGRYLQHRQALAARNEDVVWLDVQVPHTLRVTVHKARDHLQGCSREHHGHTHTRNVRVILVLRLTKRRARIKKEDEPFASKRALFENHVPVLRWPITVQNAATPAIQPAHAPPPSPKTASCQEKWCKRAVGGVARQGGGWSSQGSSHCEPCDGCSRGGPSLFETPPHKRKPPPTPFVSHAAATSLEASLVETTINNTRLREHVACLGLV